MAIGLFDGFRDAFAPPEEGTFGSDMPWLPGRNLLTNFVKSDAGQGVWDFLNEAPEQDVQQVGSPDDVTDLNQANVEQFRQMLQGQLGNAQGNINAGAQGLAQGQDFNFGQNTMQRLASQGNAGQQNAAINQIMGQQHDPMAAQNAFLSSSPQFQQLARDTVDRGPAMARAQGLSDQAVEDTLQRFSGAGFGGVSSGAATQAAAGAAMQPLLDAEAQLTQQETQLAGNLMGRAQNQLGNQFLQGQQLRQQALGQGLQGMGNLNQQDMQRLGMLTDAQAQQQQLQNQASQGLGQLGMGQYQSALPQMGSISQQNYWQPEYLTTPSRGQQLWAGLQGMGSSAAGGLMSALPALLTMASDKRLKKNIRYDKDEDIKREFGVYPATWQWKHNNQSGSGFIAQDIEKRRPDVVELGADGIKRINYTKLLGD